MKAFRSGLLVALVLVTAVVVVASPAFATPNVTASSGTRAVSPFITPIGSTTSGSRGLSTDSRFDLGGASLTCRRAIARLYVPATHTQGLVTSLRFGEPGRSPGECAVSFIFNGTIDGTQVIDPTTNSTTPSRLHVRTVSGTSATGTINVSGAFTFVVTIVGVSCTLTVPVQSVDGVYTSTTRSLAVSDRTVTTTVAGGGGCPASGNATFTAIYTVTPETTRDVRLTVTAAS
jgi:hypothetical protein